MALMMKFGTMYESRYLSENNKKRLLNIIKKDQI